MNKLIFTLSPSGKYSVVDNNDEKLFILAQTLINDNIRNNIKKILNEISALEEPYHLLSNKEDTIKFYLLKETDNYILIKVADESKPMDEANPKRIDMNCQTYLDLIEDWEDLMIMEPTQIFFKREEDNYTLTDNPDI